MLSCSIWFSTPRFWKGGGLESRCVGRVYGADGAVRLARHHLTSHFRCPLQSKKKAYVSMSRGISSMK